MTKRGAAALAAMVLLLAGCAPAEAEPVPTVTVTVTERAAPAPPVTVTVTPEAAPPASTPDDDAGGGDDFDLTTDAGLCAADAELTNLELNDAIAPLLGFPADRDLRSFEDDGAIRAYKNEAFQRECPARAG